MFFSNKRYVRLRRGAYSRAVHIYIFSEISGSYERQALLQVVPEGLLIHTGTAIRSSRAAVQSRSLNRTFFFFFSISKGAAGWIRPTSHLFILCQYA